MEDAVKKMEALVSTLPRRTQKLSWNDRCAAFAALKCGIPQSIVVRAFAITSGTASMMANHDKYVGIHGHGRYQDVAREFDKLGKQAFCDLYLTDEIDTKLRRYVHGVETEEDIPVNRFGPDPKSDKFADRPFIIELGDGTQLWTIVGWRATNEDMADDDSDLPAGWAWRYLDAREVERDLIIGRRRRNPGDRAWSQARWRTTGQALDGAFESHGLEPLMIEAKQRLAARNKMDSGY